MTNARPYHHGALESSILAVAVAEIERVGYENLSLRELATAVGVSRGAPYRHFPNRRYFLEALIARGLGMLNDQLSEASSKFETPIEKVRAAFLQYLQFSEDHPQLYRLCFASDMFIEQEPEEEFKRDARQRFGYFTTYVSMIAPDLARDELELRAISCWSLLHGFAVLSTTERLYHIVGSSRDDFDCRQLIVEHCLLLPTLPIQKQ